MYFNIKYNVSIINICDFMYNYKDFEKKWQKTWEESKVNCSEIDINKPKYFIIWAYLTVSGFQHVGHMRGYSYADAISRYKRMRGYNVLMPAGGHASGNGAVAKAQKVKEGDQEAIEYYRDRGLSDNDLKKISTPEGFVSYFSEKYIQDYKDYGFIVDDRRFTVTTYPDYNKFIEWQFKKLNEQKLLIQKPYFATACVKCGPVAVDPSEMDLSKGGTAEKNEYTLLKLKFEKDNQFIVVATLRPETIFGQTNIWLDYYNDYVKIQVGNEVWIGSQEFAEKLKYQKDDTKIIGTVKGKELVGKYVTSPKINRDIIILPSSFCDPKIGTGIVTSVPSDAPSDYMGLYDLQTSELECKKYGLNYSDIKNIKLISIIKSKGYGDYPAKEICERLNIRSQKDEEKLEEAKKEIYKIGFHTGIMKDNCEEFANQKVEAVKDKIKDELIKNNQAYLFYDLSEEVLCRCGEQVIIKRIVDQWFIKYSDEELTKKTLNHTKEMNILPEQFKHNLSNILNWFDDRACARQGRWLGTKLPFDDSYVIEPISDSTLYPIYYLVSLYVNRGELKVEQLTEEFFDFVFIEKGDINKISKDTGVSIELLEKIRKDVDYWYPLDINLGGQEHQTVHFPTFLMNHVALLPEKYYPQGIFVNWWVVSKTGKISKSKGGVGSIGREAKKYSIDAIRLFYANVASPFSNISFEEDDLLIYKTRLEKIFGFVESILENKDLMDKKEDKLDLWLESIFNIRLNTITQAMEKIEFKVATDEIYFNFYNDLVWYQRRGGNNKNIFKKILHKWIKTMGLFTPHMAEELNSLLGYDDLVISSHFPEIDEIKIDFGLVEAEKKIDDLAGEIRTVIKMANLEKVSKVTLFVSDDWKYKFYKELIEELKTTKNVGQLVSLFISRYEEHKEDISKTITRLMKNPVTDVITTQKEEFAFYKDIEGFLENIFNCDISIKKAEDFDNPKARVASPGRPGILVE